MIIDDLWWFMIEFPAESSESLNSSPFQTSGSILCWYQTWTAKLELRRILNGGMTRSSRKHQHHKNNYIDVHFTSFSMIFYDFLRGNTFESLDSWFPLRSSSSTSPRLRAPASDCGRRGHASPCWDPDIPNIPRPGRTRPPGRCFKERFKEKIRWE